MNMNSSLDRRYSFNNTQIHPVAESTCVNWNGNSSQVRSSFRWGSPVNSPKQRNNLNSTVKREQSSLRDKYYRGLNSDRSQDNGYKIEPRIYADVQSRGLSSRIVKYHESGARLNRSMSAYNLNCKPGQFPLVHLKKTPLPMRAIKHTLSMTYIPPPEKSAFQGNTLCGLLRSNSVLGLHKSDDVSHENRPILHPPPTKDDLAPTRSVLDVLKEISRKRINSEDLSNSEAAYNFKRQRDINVNTYAATQPCAKVLTPPSPTASPEQPKKRLCHYNNDITSSLSSSIKRKLNDKKMFSQTMQSNNCDTSLITQRTKMLKQNSPSSHANIDHLRKQAIEKITPITPIPDTPQILPCTDITDTPPHRRSLEATTQKSLTKQTINDERSKTTRLTLFNKNYDETTTNEICDRIENREGVGQCVGIQFVKPKKLDSMSGKNNPLLERNKKSKLARMLRSLKGELYHEEEEEEKELKSVAQSGQTETDGKALKEVANMSNTSATQSPENSAHISATATLHGPLNVLTNKVTTETTNVTAVMTPAPVPLVAANINKTSPLVGIKLTPQKPLDTAGSSIATEMKSSTAPVINNPSPAVLTGFSFGSNACTAPSTISQTPPSTTTTNSTNSAPLCNFTFGSSKIVPTTTTIKTTINPLNTNTSTISFTSNLGQPLTTNAKVVTATTTATVSTASSTSTTIPLTNNSEKEQSNFNLTFGSTTTNNTQMTLGTSTNLINFDSFTSPTTSVAMQPATITSGFNFTPNVNNAQPPITFSTATPTAANTPNFTFAAPVPLKSATPFAPAGAINTNKSAADAKPTFAIAPNNTTKAGGFSFAPANNAFAQNKPLAAAAPFSFGGTTPAKSDNTSKPFSFGSTATPPRTVTDKIIFNQNNSTPAAATTAHTSNTFNTFITGKTSSQSTFDSAVQPSFASLSNNAQTRSIAGTTNTNTNVTMFGSNINNAPAPAFGSTNNSTFIPSVTATTAAATNPTSSDVKKGFSFGSVTNTNTSFGGLAGTNAQNSMFAPKPTNAAASETKSFSFGSNASANNGNLFKNPFKTVSEPPSKGGFAFGSAAVATPLTATSSAPTPNSFTFTNNPNPNNNFAAPNQNNSAPPPFSFAATTTTSNTAPATKPFSFGSTAATASKQPSNASNGSGTPATNIFGTGPTPPAPAFNFGATTSSATVNTTVVPQNMFASGSNSPTTTGDRPIRRATRRLQKS